MRWQHSARLEYQRKVNKFVHGGNLREAIDKYNVSGSKIIDFSSNINPLGIPQDIKSLIKKEFDELVQHYPDPEYKLLTQTLSETLNVGTENLLPGNGSNELIYLLVNMLAPKKVLIPVPAYSEYERASASINSKCEFLNFMTGDGFDFRVDEVLKKCDEGLDAIFICNPNNPTGLLVQKEEIEYLVKKCDTKSVFVAIDEAFIDFVEESEKFTLIKLAVKSKNVAVLRSLTKFFAIPGLRLGYLVSNSKLVEKLSKRQPIWSVNNMVQYLGVKLLKNYDFSKKTREYILKERKRFTKELGCINWLKPYKSSANFILCKIKECRITSNELCRYCIGSSGILVRDCSNFRGLGNSFIRIAVKTRVENEKLVDCFKNF